MKVALFQVGGGPQRVGVVDGDELVDVTGWLTAAGPCPMATFLERTGAGDAPDLSGERVAAGEVTWLPPTLGAATFLCIGLNYQAHVDEGHNIADRPPGPSRDNDHPSIFARYWPTVVGHGQAIIRPRVSTMFDYEGELGVVIGKACREVPRERALDVVGGYTIGQDGSIRDWQMHSPTWTAGKNFASTGAVGPWLVTADEVPDPSALRLTTTVSGETLQDADTSQLIFDVPYLIEYITAFMPLFPGDLILTGTPSGVGIARTPKRFLVPGDTVSVEISGIGRLDTPVIDQADLPSG